VRCDRSINTAGNLFFDEMAPKQLGTWVRYINSRVIPRCYQQFFWYRYFAGIRFTWRSVFLVGITNLVGTPFFHKRGLAVSKRGPVPPFFLKKGASAPFLREKGVPAKKMILKCTDRDFLRYRYGKYQEIPTDTDRKIPIRYTTLINSGLEEGEVNKKCLGKWR
jgi:hypothetical protein